MSREKAHSADIVDRLKTQLSLKTDAELAKFLNFAANTVSAWRTRNSRLPINDIIAKCDDAEKIVDWNYVIHGASITDVSGREGMQPYGLNAQPSSKMVPVFLVPAPAGSLQPSDDHVNYMMSASELGIPDGRSIFVVKVVGDSMTGVGIEEGDMVVVDKSIVPKPGAIVVATVDSELTIKKFQRMGERTLLYPANSDYKPIEVIEGMSVEVWGVAIRVIKPLPFPR